MKTKLILPTLLACFAFAFTGQAQDQPPTEAEKTSQTLTTAYVAAFNKGDVKALGALYAEEAQFTNDEGETISGRAAVVEGLTKFFKANKGAKLAIKVESSRFITPDVLVERGLATVNDDTTRYLCNYVKKDGAWVISELTETALPAMSAGEVALGELAWMVGTWKDHTPGVAVTADVAWTKNQHFLRRSVTVSREGSDPVEATEIIGYDAAAGQLRSWIFDSEGGFGHGTWRRENHQWLVTFSATAPDGTISTAQQVITYLENNKYTWESINRQREGEALPNIDKVEVVRTPAK